MQKKVQAISAAISAVLLSSASLSKASTTLFSDTFSDGNPLTVNGTPTWTAGSVEQNLGEPNSALTETNPPDPSTLANPITANSGSQIQEANNSLTLSATQNGGDVSGASNLIGPAMVLNQATSALNFWEHPVQITLTAPPGGNLMPLATHNGDTDYTANNSFLYFEVAPGNGDPRNTANQTYFRISPSQNSDNVATGPANQVVTQYVFRSTSPALNNATPAFTNPQPIDPLGRITAVTLFLDGSRYDPSKGAGGQDSNGVALPNNSTPFMFNWGITSVDSSGVSHQYWLWSSGVPQTTSGAMATDGTRADSNFGSGDYGGSGQEGVNILAMYNNWSQNGTIARNNLNGYLGIELLRQLTGDQYPTSVTLGSITVTDPQSPGDVNYDGVVDSRDFNVLAANYNGTGPTNTSDGSVNGKIWEQGDMNGDGIVNAEDFAILASNYGTNYNAPAAGAALGTVVPEPTALAGLVLAACGLVRRRRA